MGPFVIKIVTSCIWWCFNLHVSHQCIPNSWGNSTASRSWKKSQTVHCLWVRKQSPFSGLSRWPGKPQARSEKLLSTPTYNLLQHSSGYHHRRGPSKWQPIPPASWLDYDGSFHAGLIRCSRLSKQCTDMWKYLKCISPSRIRPSTNLCWRLCLVNNNNNNKHNNSYSSICGFPIAAIFSTVYTTDFL